MEHFKLIRFSTIVYILFMSNLSCYSQCLKISKMHDQVYDSNNLWIKIKVINNCRDTIYFPENPEFGYENDTSVDLFFNVKRVDSDTTLNFINEIHYTSVILSNSKIKIPPKKSYSFSYNVLNLYPLNVTKKHKICLYYLYRLDGKMRKVVSNILSI
jgi:hypothetical protein